MKVAIVGTAPSSRILAPYDDKSWEIWACSPNLDLHQNTFGNLPRISKFFELHKIGGPELSKNLSIKQQDAFLKWMEQSDFEVIANDTKSIKGSKPYPLEEIIKEYGRYFTNTVSYMIAYAIHCKATHIHVFGVDMMADTEYGIQRPSCEYWLGVAKGKGIDVHVPSSSDLLKTTRLYAFDPPGDFREKLDVRAEEITARLNQTKEEVFAYARASGCAASAAQEMDYLKTLLNGEATPELIAKIDERKLRAVNEANELSKKAEELKQLELGLIGAEENMSWVRQWPI